MIEIKIFSTQVSTILKPIKITSLLITHDVDIFIPKPWN